MTVRTNGVPETEYILGHSEREIRRLMHQAAILRPITERLLRARGSATACGSSTWAAGPATSRCSPRSWSAASGSVVGIDRNPDVIAVARERARTAGLRHVDFEEASVEAFSDPEPFDAVIGRYVLIHQADPAAFIRAAADLVRPGGVVAFHELCIHGQVVQSLPSVSLWQQAGRMDPDGVPGRGATSRCGRSADRALLPRRPAAADLVLRVPRRWRRGFATQCLDRGHSRELLPQLARMRVLTADTIAIETFETRLRDAVVEARSQIVGPGQFWPGPESSLSPVEAGVASKGLQAKTRQRESVVLGPIISPS